MGPPQIFARKGLLALCGESGGQKRGGVFLGAFPEFFLPFLFPRGGGTPFFEPKKPNSPSQIQGIPEFCSRRFPEKKKINRTKTHTQTPWGNPGKRHPPHPRFFFRGGGTSPTPKKNRSRFSGGTGGRGGDGAWGDPDASLGSGAS